MKIKKLKKKILVDRFTLKKTADIHLLDDEFVTFRDKKQEYDFSKKNWGYYISPSLNKRLKKNYYEIVIIKNKLNRFFLCSVKKDKRKIFNNHLKKTNQYLICTLNNKFLNNL